MKNPDLSLFFFGKVGGYHPHFSPQIPHLPKKKTEKNPLKTHCTNFSLFSFSYLNFPNLRFSDFCVFHFYVGKWHWFCYYYLKLTKHTLFLAPRKFPKTKTQIPHPEVFPFKWDFFRWNLIGHWMLRSQGGEVKKDITDEECQGGCVQAAPSGSWGARVACLSVHAPFFLLEKNNKEEPWQFHVAFVVENYFIVFNDLPSLKLT